MQNMLYENNTYLVFNKDLKPISEPVACANYVHDVIYKLYTRDSSLFPIVNWENFSRLRGGDICIGYLSKRENCCRHAKKLKLFLAKLSKKYNNKKKVKILGVSDNKTLEKIGIKPKDVGLILAFPSTWWLKSSVSISLLTTLLKLSRLMRFGESVEGFSKRMEDRKDLSKSYKKDVIRFKKSIENGNIEKILSSRARCVNRYFLADLLLTHHDRDIANYDESKDNFPRIKKSILKVLNGQG